MHNQTYIEMHKNKRRKNFLKDVATVKRNEKKTDYRVNLLEQDETI